MKTPWRRDERKKALFISRLPLFLYFLSVLPISYFLCLGCMQFGIFIIKEKKFMWDADYGKAGQGCG
jgi:hypothetical protein